MELGAEQLFEHFDKMEVGCADYINSSVTLSEFGKFCNILIEYLGPLMAAWRSKSDNFYSLLERVKTSFDSFIAADLFSEDPSFQKTMAKIQPLLSEPSDPNMLQLERVYFNYYKVFYYKLRRAQSHLVMCTQSWRTNEHVRAQKSITAYIDNMIARKPEGLELMDALLLQPDTCSALEQFLVKKMKPMLKCSCGQRADVFAYPCNCPCYCNECWELQEKKTDEFCPVCRRPCDSMIEVTH